MKHVYVLKTCGLICTLLYITGCMTTNHNGLTTTTATEASMCLARANAGVRRFTLDNGMVCLVAEDKSAPVVSLQIWVGTGSIHEQEYTGSGICHAIEHMIFKGTPSRPAGLITREIDNSGGKINAYTSFDRTVFHTDMPARSWKVGLSVLSDAVMNANFPEDEWQRERDVIIREIAMNNDDPQRVVGNLLFATAYRVHPYRFPVIGQKSKLEVLKRDDLIKFFKRRYTPDNMIFAVVGDINADEVETSIREVFGNFTSTYNATPVLPQEPPQLSERFVVQTGAYNVARLEWAYHTVPLSHPDAPAFDVLATVVGSGKSSRLVRNIREKKKLVHDIDAWSYTPKEAGLFGFSAVFEPSKQQEVISAIKDEITQWAEKGFTSDEVSKAQRQVLSSIVSELQTMHGRADSLASGEYYAGDFRYSETYLRQIGEITPERLREVVQKYLLKTNASIVVLTPQADSSVTKTQDIQTVSIKPSMVKLSSGIKLISREDKKLPFVHIAVVFGGGLLSETAQNNGITRLMSELLLRGAGGLSTEQIAETVESRGGSISAFSGHNSWGLTARCFSEDVETFIQLIATCVTKPEFPDSEIEKQKNLQIALIQQQLDKPFYLAQEKLRLALFAGHPYRFDPLGRKSTVPQITREQLKKYHQEHLSAENTVIAIFGNINLSRAKELVEQYFKLPHGMNKALGGRSAIPRIPSREITYAPREQAIILMGLPGVNLTDPRRDILDLLDNCMSGLSSDLATEIREKRGLVYYVGAYNMIGVDPGAFVFYAGTRPDKIDEIERLMSAELERVIQQGIRQEELDRARNQILAEYEMSLQDNGGLALKCALDELYGCGYDYLFTLDSRISKLVPEDIKRAASSLFLSDKVVISVVLPEKSR